MNDFNLLFTSFYLFLCYWRVCAIGKFAMNCSNQSCKRPPSLVLCSSKNTLLCLPLLAKLDSFDGWLWRGVFGSYMGCRLHCGVFFHFTSIGFPTFQVFPPYPFFLNCFLRFWLLRGSHLVKSCLHSMENLNHNL